MPTPKVCCLRATELRSSAGFCPPRAGVFLTGHQKPVQSLASRFAAFAVLNILYIGVVEGGRFRSSADRTGFVRQTSEAIQL